ncbi:MAG TPA: serine protease [Minicystis sp.]|nr:serine protease [Minicystis sp.]
MSVVSKKKRRFLRAAERAMRVPVIFEDDGPPPVRSTNAWEAEIELAGPAAYPIIHYQRLKKGEGLYSIDKDNQGSAFFVSMGPLGGVFLTARHVVETHSDAKPYSLLILDLAKESFYATRVLKLALHPTLDAAIGAVGLAHPVKEWRVGRRRLSKGEPFITFGFPSTRRKEVQTPYGRQLRMNYLPAEVKGFIADFQDDEPRYGPVYIHETWVDHGISGGPLVSPYDGRVYALNSRGFRPREAVDEPALEMALSLDGLLSWSPPLLDGRTLGDFLAEHERRVDERDARAEAGT